MKRYKKKSDCHPKCQIPEHCEVCSQGDGGILAFSNTFSKEAVADRGLKYRSCSLVCLSTVVMLLLSAMLKGILAVGVMRNMLGWSYSYHFCVALIVAQCS